MLKSYTLIFFLILSTFCSGQVEYDKFSREELQEDLEYFSGMVTSIHPLLLDKNVKSQWEREYTIIRNNLKEMTRNQFYLSLAFIMSSLNDGHSGVELPLEQRIKYNEAGGLAFPFLVNIEDYKVYVDFYCGNDSSLFSGGEEIVTINGIPVTEMVKYMQRLYGTKSAHMRQQAVATQFRFLLWIMYGFEGDYELVYKDETGAKKKIRVPGVTADEFRENIKRKPVTDTSLFDLQMSEDKNLAIMKISSFGQLEDFCAFADNAFSLISEKKIENLAIDIRGNAGGRSIVVDSLMNYLTDREYAQYRKIEVRVSEPLKERYKEKYPDQLEWINRFEIDQIAVPELHMVQPNEKNARFSGNLYLLTDKETFSAAATFAGVFKELKLGSIIGEETGGSIQYFGDYWLMTMPNTGIRFYVAPKRFTQYGNEDPKKGVMPDHPVENRGDNVIKALVELIGKE